MIRGSNAIPDLAVMGGMMEKNKLERLLHQNMIECIMTIRM